MNTQTLLRVLPRPVIRILMRIRELVRALAAGLRSASGRRPPLPSGTLDCVLARNRHGVYCVPRSAAHRPAARAVLQGRVWEPETLGVLCKAPGDIVHAGAFYGDFLPALARSRRADELVWAFEPGRENHRCAQATVLLNGLENVRLEHAAVSSKNGRTLLATSTRGGKPLGGSSRILKDPGNAGRVTTEEISLVTVDELLPEERLVGALHLDVEGHLREALEGAMVMVERCRPLLVLEGSPDADWIDSLLRPLGYAMEGWVHANMVLRAADPRQSVQ